MFGKKDWSAVAKFEQIGAKFSASSPDLGQLSVVLHHLKIRHYHVLYSSIKDGIYHGLLPHAIAIQASLAKRNSVPLVLGHFCSVIKERYGKITRSNRVVGNSFALFAFFCHVRGSGEELRRAERLETGVVGRTRS